MARLLRWFSVVLFLTLPFVCLYGIYVGDIKYLWYFTIISIFSIMSGGFSDALKRSEDSDGTLF